MSVPPNRAAPVPPLSIACERPGFDVGRQESSAENCRYLPFLRVLGVLCGSKEFPELAGSHSDSSHRILRASRKFETFVRRMRKANRNAQGQQRPQFNDDEQRGANDRAFSNHGKLSASGEFHLTHARRIIYGRYCCLNPPVRPWRAVHGRQVCTARFKAAHYVLRGPH
jgi:hypothetical protein